MRPIVFGPSPFMQVAEGVLGAKQNAAAAALAADDRQRKLAHEDQQSQLGALDIASKTIANMAATRSMADKSAKAAKVQADAERLRSSPYNTDGRYGKPGDPVDTEHDYASDFDKEQKVGLVKQGLLAQGYKPEQADEIARANFDREKMASEKESRGLGIQKTKAEIDRLRAQAIRDRAAAATGGTGGMTPTHLGAQEVRDRSRVAGWATATMQAGETDPQRLTAAALAMNPKMNPQTVAAAIADAQTKWNSKTATEGRLLNRSLNTPATPATPSAPAPAAAPTPTPEPSTPPAAAPLGYDAKAYAADDPPGYRAWVDRKTGKTP